MYFTCIPNHIIFFLCISDSSHSFIKISYMIMDLELTQSSFFQEYLYSFGEIYKINRYCLHLYIFWDKLCIMCTFNNLVMKYINKNHLSRGFLLSYKILTQASKVFFYIKVHSLRCECVY